MTTGHMRPEILQFFHQLAACKILDTFDVIRGEFKIANQLWLAIDYRAPNCSRIQKKRGYCFDGSIDSSQRIRCTRLVDFKRNSRHG